MTNGDEWLQAEANRAARGRACENALSKAQESYAKEVFALGYETGRDAQIKVNQGVARRLQQLVKEAKVTRFFGNLESFLEKAVQIWATPGERFVPEEAAPGGADAPGRGDDPETVGDGAAEEGVSESAR